MALGDFVLIKLFPKEKEYPIGNLSYSNAAMDGNAQFFYNEDDSMEELIGARLELAAKNVLKFSGFEYVGNREDDSAEYRHQVWILRYA